MSANWKQRRDIELEALTDAADLLLVDRTVIHAVAVPHDDSVDCANVIRLTLDNGKVIDITGGYGGYSGHSCDEYVELISVDEVPS